MSLSDALERDLSSIIEKMGQDAVYRPVDRGPYPVRLWAVCSGFGSRPDWVDPELEAGMAVWWVFRVMAQDLETAPGYGDEIEIGPDIVQVVASKPCGDTRTVAWRIAGTCDQRRR